MLEWARQLRAPSISDPIYSFSGVEPFSVASSLQLAMTDICQIFPPELLTEILGHVSGRDIPRLLQVNTKPLYVNRPAKRRRYSQVNRTFYDIVLGSTVLRHRMDLFSAGLEYNATAGANLTDSKTALSQYRSNLESSHLVQRRI